MTETKISHFRSTKDTEVVGSTTIEQLLGKIKDGEWIEDIEKLRSGNKFIKQQLPTFAIHGTFKNFRKKADFIESSGIIILDIDDVEDDLEEVKEDIMESSESVLAAMVSPSGDGIKVLYYVDAELVNQDSYKSIGKELVSNFEIYGSVDYLSITDCLIATYDPDILINENCIPDRVYIKQTERLKGKLPKLDESKTLWDDPEDFFETVLFEDIASKTNNNYEFIQISMLDLKKFGFEHPKEDLSFVIDYAETTFKASNQNKTRFLEMVEVAKNYPQTEHAYKLYLETDLEDDEYVDYSEWKEGSVVSEDEQDEEEYNGLIDYANLWERCLQTIEEGDRVGYEVALSNLAEVLRFKGTGIFTITGIPGHGKTEMVDAILLDLARLYGQQSIIAGFEQSPEEHIIKLMRKMTGVDIRCTTYRNNPKNEPILKSNYEFITKHFLHIDVDRTGGSCNEILKYVANIVKEQRGAGNDPKYLVLDPFNMLTIKGKFSGHEKVEEILRRVTHFSHQMGILVFLVAHPTKMPTDEKTGQFKIPDFYSVKGSSAFYEMSYHGAVVYRNPDGSVLFKILKVKQNNLGTTGAEVFFYYDRLSGRYIPIDEEGNELSGDHREKNWLEKYKTNKINK